VSKYASIAEVGFLIGCHATTSFHAVHMQRLPGARCIRRLSTLPEP